MRRFSGIIVSGLALFSMAGLELTTATAAEEDYTSVAMSGRDLTTKELYRLYGGQSWIWKDGVAYFQISRRAFRAFTGLPESDATYADGRWFLPGHGKACFRATWYTVAGNSESVSCYAHKMDTHGTIYMHRHPSGKWFILSRDPPHAWDEVKKFKPGDRTANGYQRNKAHIDSSRKEKTCLEKGWPPLLCNLFGT